MISTFYTLPFLLITVFILIRAEFNKNNQQIYIFKPLSSVLVIATLLLSSQIPHADLYYSIGILIGLIFTLLGDLALMFPTNEKAFKIGLGSFLLAHVIYSTIFLLYGEISVYLVLPALILTLLGICIFFYLKPNLGKMMVPVLVYIIIISLMVICSFSLLRTINKNRALMVIIGAALFYISDLILAVNRFGTPWKYHRISLVFYYSGQILIALSAGSFLF